MTLCTTKIKCGSLCENFHKIQYKTKKLLLDLIFDIYMAYWCFSYNSLNIQFFFYFELAQFSWTQVPHNEHCTMSSIELASHTSGLTSNFVTKLKRKLFLQGKLQLSINSAVRPIANKYPDGKRPRTLRKSSEIHETAQR